MRSKRILSLVLALVMVLGTFGTVFAEPTDNMRVDWLIEEGLVKGYGDGTFGLAQAITRAEVATMVVRALGLEEEAGKMVNIPSVFADMRGTNVAWANGYVNVAVGKGIINGYEDGTFKPSQDITYAEVAAILVRALDGMTPAEIAAATGRDWATTYLVKAAELGVLDDVVILDFNAKAQRETIFEMVYNTIHKGFGNFSILKVIVLENGRVETVKNDEIVVEVIEEIQRANFADDSRDKKGDQVKYTLDAKVGDAEDLLGKVVNLTIDRNNKVVKVEADKTYEYITGDFEATRTRMGKYTVELDERYRETDERIFRTYYNNEPVSYFDFYQDPTTTVREDEFAVDYARMTVKNGKVLFIDAFNFEDIMPVKEIKNDRIVAYDDVRDGNTIEIKVSDDRVVIVRDDSFMSGTLEDVKADNVIHKYKEGNTTKYLVLQDQAIEGKLERIKEDRNDVYLVVDGEDYTIPTVSPKMAVYEFQSNDKFYTLAASRAYRELDTFRGQEVRVLLGLDGKLQYVGSPIEIEEFVGVATKIVGREMRVLNPDNKLMDFEANLDTSVTVNGATTGHQGLNSIPRNSLVYVNGDEKVLLDVESLDKRVAVDAGFNRVNINSMRITDNTVVFVVNSKGNVEVRKIADVVKAYDKLSAADQAKVRVSLINEQEFDAMSVRGYKFYRPGNVHSMVLYDLEIAPLSKDSVYGKLIRYDNRRIGQSEIVVELPNSGARVSFTLASSVDETTVNWVLGDIYEIVESKDTEGLALEVTKVAFDGYHEVKSIANWEYEFVGTTTLAYENGSTDFFGRKPVRGDKISYVLNSYNELVLVVNPGFGTTTPPTLGRVVTYINGTTGVLTVDGTSYAMNALTILNTHKGTLITVGASNIDNTTTGLAVGDEVTDIVLENGIIKTLKATKIASVETTAVTNVINTLNSAALNPSDSGFSPTAVVSARSAYNALTPAQKDYVTNYAKLVAAENKVKADQQVIVQAAKTALVADATFLGSNPDLNNVTTPLILPTTGTGVTISWTSDDTGAINSSGNVVRPSYTVGDKTVKLTATIASIVDSTVTDTKVFTVVVKALPATAPELRLEAVNTASTAAQMEVALQAMIDATELVPGSWGSLVAAQRETVAQTVLNARPAAGFVNAAAVQVAFDAAL